MIKHIVTRVKVQLKTTLLSLTFVTRSNSSTPTEVVTAEDTSQRNDAAGSVSMSSVSTAVDTSVGHQGQSSGSIQTESGVKEEGRESKTESVAEDLPSERGQGVGPGAMGRGLGSGAGPWGRVTRTCDQGSW